MGIAASSILKEELSGDLASWIDCASVREFSRSSFNFSQTYFLQFLRFCAAPNTFAPERDRLVRWNFTPVHPPPRSCGFWIFLDLDIRYPLFSFSSPRETLLAICPAPPLASLGVGSLGARRVGGQEGRRFDSE